MQVLTQVSLHLMLASQLLHRKSRRLNRKGKTTGYNRKERTARGLSQKGNEVSMNRKSITVSNHDNPNFILQLYTFKPLQGIIDLFPYIKYETRQKKSQ